MINVSVCVISVIDIYIALFVVYIYLITHFVSVMFWLRLKSSPLSVYIFLILLLLFYYCCHYYYFYYYYCCYYCYYCYYFYYFYHFFIVIIFIIIIISVYYYYYYFFISLFLFLSLSICLIDLPFIQYVTTKPVSLFPSPLHQLVSSASMTSLRCLSRPPRALT